MLDDSTALSLCLVSWCRLRIPARHLLVKHPRLPVLSDPGSLAFPPHCRPREPLAPPEGRRQTDGRQQV